MLIMEEESVYTWNDVKIGVRQYFRPTPKNIRKFLLGFKAIMGSAAIGNALAERWWWSIGILVAGAIVDELVNFIGEHPAKTIIKSEIRLIRDEEAAKQ